MSKEEVKLCEAVTEAYMFPVTSMVIGADGRLFGKLNANQLLDLAFRGEFIEAQTCAVSLLYEKFLVENSDK